MISISICTGPPATCVGAELNAGATAAPAPPVPAALAVVGCPGTCVCGTAVGCGGSGSRMSAPSPRPSAFLGIGNYLLGQLCVSLSALAMDIVENNRLTKTWRFRQPHIARNQTLEHLRSKETTQIRGYLPR